MRTIQPCPKSLMHLKKSALLGGSRRRLQEFIRHVDWNEEYIRKAELADRMIGGRARTIRLLPKHLDGEDYWFGTAVAGGIVDFGIPVAIPASCMERSAASWGDMVNMTGKVRLLRDGGLDFVAEQVHHAPPALIFVEEMTVTKRTRDHLEPRMIIRPVVLLSLNAPDDPKNLSFAFIERVQVEGDKSRHRGSFIGTCCEAWRSYTDELRPSHPRVCRCSAQLPKAFGEEV